MKYTNFVATAKSALYAKELWWSGENPIILTKRWETGGMEGGNYQGGNLYRIEGSTEPDFDMLDVVLEEVAPQTTFLQYKQLVKDLAVKTSVEEQEYYGNYTEHTTVTLELCALHTWLETNNLL